MLTVKNTLPLLQVWSLPISSSDFAQISRSLSSNFHNVCLENINVFQIFVSRQCSQYQPKSCTGSNQSRRHWDPLASGQFAWWPEWTPGSPLIYTGVAGSQKAQQCYLAMNSNNTSSINLLLVTLALFSLSKLWRH